MVRKKRQSNEIRKARKSKGRDATEQKQLKRRNKQEEEHQSLRYYLELLDQTRQSKKLTFNTIEVTSLPNIVATTSVPDTPK